MSTLTQKIDVIELLITCIKEQENQLANQINTLENLAYVKNHNK